RTDRQGAYPAFMCVDGAERLRNVGVELPGEKFARVIAGEKRLARRVKGQAAHPTLVAGERRFLPCRQFPALDRAVLGAGEDESAGGVEAATDQWAAVLQFLDLAGFRRINHTRRAAWRLSCLLFGGAHARISLIAFPLESVMGTGCWLM